MSALAGVADRYPELEVLHAARMPESTVLAAIKQVEGLLGSPLQPLLAGAEGSARRKRSLIDVYRSQLPAGGMDEIETYARRRGGERVWLDQELYSELSGLLFAQGSYRVKTGRAHGRRDARGSPDHYDQ